MKTGNYYYYYAADIKRMNILQSYFLPAIIEGNIKYENHLIKPITDREFWESRNTTLRESYIMNGEKYLGYKWQHLNIMDYYNYFRPGNVTPSKHEKIMFEKRIAILSLALAECFENKGRFVTDLVNGIFAICEETTWATASHFHACGEESRISMEGTNPIPDYHGTQILDLRVAEKAILLSFILKTFETVFNQLTPSIKNRINYELNKRFVEPYLERDNIWWFGFETNHNIWKPNNWNTVMNSSAVFYALTACEDEKIRKKILIRALKSLDIYIDYQADDGFCDEGVAYWFGAQGTLMQIIAMLDYACGSTREIFNNIKVKNMSEFIPNMRLSQKHFPAYADAHNELDIGYTARLFNIGKSLNNSLICSFAAEMMSDNADELLATSDRWVSNVEFEMGLIEDYDEIVNFHANTSSNEFEAKWYNDGQVINCRINNISFFAKYGYNNESHNHNDIGSFIVYENDKPVAIDIGVGTYTKYTFDPVERWNIFTMRSAYHNVPIINGVEQKNGQEYCAEDVVCNIGDKAIELSGNITKAYPKEAGIESYTRSFYFDENGVCVCDDFSASKPVDAEVVIVSPIKGVIANNSVDFDGCILNVTGHDDIRIEEIDFEDETIKSMWGEKLFRIIISSKDAKKIVMNFR